jgi:hypothetical protein
MPVRSLSHRERGGVRGFGLSMGFEPPHPTPLPNGERESTKVAAIAFPEYGTSESCLAHLGDLGAQFVDDVDEFRQVANVELARAREVDGLGRDDAPRP